MLISQNRQAEIAPTHELDLQIDLLAEYEMTRMLTLVGAIADHLGLDCAKDPDAGGAEANIAPRRW